MASGACQDNETDIEQELGNLLPFEVPFATILTMVEVDRDYPGFKDPTKFVGPVYFEAESKSLAAEKGWTIKLDSDKWRRVVASPLPKQNPTDEMAAREGNDSHSSGWWRHTNRI
jgi:carbamate kinase